MPLRILFLLCLVSSYSFAGRKFGSGPTTFVATFNRDPAGGTWTGGQQILRSELIAITNASDIPQNIKITAKIEGLTWVLYKVGTPEQVQGLNKISVFEATREPGLSSVSASCTPPPLLCEQKLAPVRLAAHQTMYRAVGVSFLGPLAGYNDAPHIRLQGSIRYIFEVEEDRGAIYASSFTSMNVGLNAILFDTNSVFLNPTTVALNGGRPF